MLSRAWPCMLRAGRPGFYATTVPNQECSEERTVVVDPPDSWWKGLQQVHILTAQHHIIDLQRGLEELHTTS